MSQFRSFYPTLSVANTWYPLHMATGLKKIQRILKDIDCVIEVHDARIPISGRSSAFHQQVICGKPHLLILNKMDLIDMNFKNDIDQKLLGTCDRILYTMAAKQTRKNIEQILPNVHEIIKLKPKFNRADKFGTKILIVGVPNVGKSSIINALRSSIMGKPEVMAVAPHAGVTRTVSNSLKISNDPLTYLFDTPGILEPSLEIPESAMRLALCGLLKDAAVGEERIADYLLYWFNKRKLFHYANVLGLPEPCDNISEVLTRIAIRESFFTQLTDPRTRQTLPRVDILRSAQFMIKMFRDGTFGTFLLDDDLLYRSKRTGIKTTLR